MTEPLCAGDFGFNNPTQLYRLFATYPAFSLPYGNQD